MWQQKVSGNVATIIQVSMEIWEQNVRNKNEATEMYQNDNKGIVKIKELNDLKFFHEPQILQTCFSIKK